MSELFIELSGFAGNQGIASEKADRQSAGAHKPRGQSASASAWAWAVAEAERTRTEGRRSRTADTSTAEAEAEAEAGRFCRPSRIARQAERPN